MQNTVRFRRTSTRYTPFDDHATRTLFTLKKYIQMYHEKNVVLKLHIINFFYIKNDTYVVRIEF